MADEEFERIVSTVPELGGMDNGETIIISQGDEVYRYPHLEYSRWVEAFLDHCLEKPDRWLDWIAEVEDQPELVINSLIRNTYRVLSNTLLDEVEPAGMRQGFLVLNRMATYLASSR